jgi:antitoxin component YwqK of YwqJK toxin-antitoxin module
MNKIYLILCAWIVVFTGCGPSERELELEEKLQQVMEIQEAASGQFQTSTDPLQAEVTIDITKQESLNFALEHAIPLGTTQLRDGAIYQPNVISKYSGFASADYANGQIFLLANVKDGDFAEVWAWTPFGTPMFHILMHCENEKTKKLIHYLLSELDELELDELDGTAGNIDNDYGFNVWYHSIEDFITEGDDFTVFGTWYGNGRQQYELDILDDEGREFREWFSNGQLAFILLSDSEGKLKKVESYLPDGESCPNTIFNDGSGKYVLYHQNGKVEVETSYSQGVRSGLHLEYFESGKLSRRLEYNDGNLCGDYKSWFSHGPIAREASYDEDGNLHGKYTTYYGSGDIYEQGIYSKGIKVGVWIEGGKSVTYDEFQTDEE